MPKLRNWAIVGELKPHLRGEVYDHENFEDGDEIRSSPIVEVIGDAIMTLNGTIYRLEGKPESGFAAFLASPESGARDPSHPLTQAVTRAIERSKKASDEPDLLTLVKGEGHE